MEGLRSRHENHFSERMDRTQITLGSANTTQTCPSGSMGGRLRSFGAGCRKDSTGNRNEDNDIVQGKSDNDAAAAADAADLLAESSLEQVLDVKLIAQMYMYGRYLLFSSATHAPLNLQGIWTDGPSSSWNGTIIQTHDMTIVIIPLLVAIAFCLTSHYSSLCCTMTSSLLSSHICPATLQGTIT